MTQLSGFEFAVNTLIGLGFKRDVAEEQIRRQRPDLVPTHVAPERDERTLEREEQFAIQKLLCAYGFNVRNLSQYRPSKIARGLPDLFVTHNRLPVAFFHETKRQVGGKRSSAQIQFAEDCTRCGVRCTHGDRYHVAELLIDLELAVRGDGPLGIVPVRDAAGAAP